LEFRGRHIDPVSFALGGLFTHDYGEYVQMLLSQGVIEEEEVIENYPGVLQEIRETGEKVMAEVLE